MKKNLTLWLLSIVMVLLLLAGCGPAETQQPSQTEITSTETEQPEQTQNLSQSEAPPFTNRNIAPPNLAQDASDLVSASGNCAACHSGLIANNGEDVSFAALWRASMMAHAANDPYWQATVSAETDEFPELEAVIADKCATCHMPLARFDANTNGKPTLVLGDGFLNQANQLHDLAMDSVSCNVCHQIAGDNFDTAESYSGGYLIDTENRDWGERVAYGPLPASEQGVTLMEQATGYTIVQSEHTADAALCGTCHNLFTPYLDAAGEIAGEFPEQTIYLEWQNSAFAGGSCMQCHSQKVMDISVSNVLPNPQQYLYKHTFTGANSFMLNILNDNAEATGITAEPAQMEAAIQRVSDLLGSESNTTVKMGNVTLEDGILDAPVTVSNKAGHKLPSGFPSRRAWLHVWVTDGNGEIIFESGAVDQNGKITGNDNDQDASLYEPHYQQISDPEQVQIYEAIMYNTEGEVTTTLLRAAGYLKDNRLLPSGFSLADASPDIMPYGAVLDDEDFIGGSDVIHYLVDVSEYEGPFTIRFQLLYQSIGYRWAENLRAYETAESDSFMSMFDQADKTPVEMGYTQHYQEGE